MTVIKKEDLLTGIILYDKEKSVFQHIKNEKGVVIGKRELFNNILVEENIIKGKEQKQIIFNENGVKKEVNYSYSIDLKELPKYMRKMIKKNPQLSQNFTKKTIKKEIFNKDGRLKHTIEYLYKNKKNFNQKVTFYTNNQPSEIKMAQVNFMGIKRIIFLI